MKNTLSSIAVAFCTLAASAQSWPTPAPEAKPGTRWWWLGSAVDKDNLKWSLEEYARHGIGAVEITPLYGVQRNEQNNIAYLSDKWMEMLRFTQEQCKQNNVELDMATGTGWPFGGPWVPLEESACKAVFVEKGFAGNAVEALDIAAPEKDRKYARLSKVMVYGPNGRTVDVTTAVSGSKLNWSAEQTIKAELKACKDKRQKNLLKAELKSLPDAQWKVIALYVRYGVMKVKRAAPGGEGLVIDHFDRTAVQNYLRHIEQAFERTKTPFPHTFFNDSYEVADATWTPSLLDEFSKRRGYKLENHLPELIGLDPKVLSDYRETLGDLLLEHFTEQWTAWAHSHGAITRNQAHGSPANLIDCYAAVDIPEIEGFGLSDFGIKGLRTDPGKTRKNDSDYSMFKYAPSAAHVCGKPYTSSETFTWLTEHFRTSLSQLKPDLDLMFCAGVNHIFIHGTAYSPKDDVWPGWKFYASIDMSPTNSIWRDAPFFMQYVERCQSFLQWGQPDNDFLVLLPVRDAWKKPNGKLLMQFSIHAMGELMPDFRDAILSIDRSGFDCDYISERLLKDVTCSDGMLVTKAGVRYKGLVITGSGEMAESVKQHIATLRSQGANIMFGIDADTMAKAAKAETMKTQLGLKVIRRKNNTGYHYFVANLTPDDISGYTALAVPFEQALWFNPLNGERYAATTDDSGRVLVALKSGQSMILQTFDTPVGELGTLQTNHLAPTDAAEEQLTLNGPWTLTFMDESPKVDGQYTLPKLKSWENLDEKTKVTMGTGVYTTTVSLTRKQMQHAKAWLIDLGDVRESARVFINGEPIGCAWSVPFVLDCKNTLHQGKNDIRIEVTNLPANRISHLDRQGVKWRKMEEINVVDINYKKTLYDQWEPMPSGLNSEVKLIKKL